jgi:hypothetical protein
VVQRFVERRNVIPEYLPKFHAAINSATRLRNSVPLEIGLVNSSGPSGTGSGTTRSLWARQAGMRCWKVRIGISLPPAIGTPSSVFPIFQLILLRWYLRLLIWFRFLWQVSRLHLRLTSTHPDRAGGLAFLGKSSYAFGPILFAQGALLAGLVASRVLYQGESLLSFKMKAISLVGFFVLFILGPLVMFTTAFAGPAKWIGRIWAAGWPLRAGV